jgi:ATP-dependent Clp protease adapter protein ClpS
MRDSRIDTETSAYQLYLVVHQSGQAVDCPYEGIAATTDHAHT